MNPKVRPAEPRDLEALCAHFNESIAEGDVFVYEHPITLAAVQQFAETNLTLHVAELDGKVVGGYTLRANQPGRGSHVCTATYVVARAFRGRGVGRVLGAHSIEAARELGFQAIQLNAVVATNAAAIRLWQRLGFEIVGTIPRGFRSGDGSFVDVHIAHRALSAADQSRAKAAQSLEK